MKRYALALIAIPVLSVSAFAAGADYTLQPRLLGIVASPSSTGPTDLTKVGDIVLTTDLQDGLAVFDVVDPADPFLLATLPGIYNGRIAASNTHAYVAAIAGGVTVIDVNDPTMPVVGSPYAVSDARDVAVDGDRLVVANGSGGFVVASLEDPAAPVTIRTFAMGGAHTVVSSGGLAYGLNYNQLLIIDPHSSPPAIIGSFVSAYDSKTIHVAGDLVAIAGVETVAFETYEPRVEILNVANPASPVVLADVSVGASGHSTPPLDGLWTNVSGTQLAVAPGYGELWGLFSVDSPTTATPTARFGYGFRHFVREGNLFYGSAGQGGAQVGCGTSLGILDVTLPSTLDPIGNLPGVSMDGAVVDGDRAYLVDGNNVDVVDLSDPFSPSVIGSYPAGGVVKAVGAIGDVVCVIWSESENVSVVDLADPSSPNVIWGPVSINNADLVAGEGTVFVVGTSTSSTITLIDFADPDLVLSQGVNLPFHPNAVDVGGGEVYALDVNGMLEGVAASVPTSLHYQTPVPGYGSGVTAAGGQLLVCTSPAGADLNTVEIYDVDDDPVSPLPPTFRSRIELCEKPWGVVLRDGFLYVRHQRPGLEIYDVSDVADPVRIAIYPTLEYRMLGAGTDFLVIDEDGLAALPLHVPSPPDLVDAPLVAGNVAGTLRVLSNPAHAGIDTSVLFSLRRAGFTDLRAYDVRGREVARLAFGPEPAGEHRVAWPSNLATGVYFLRLRTPESTESVKVTMVR